MANTETRRPTGMGFNDGREQSLHDHIMTLPKNELQNNPQKLLTAIYRYVSTNSRMMIFTPTKLDASREILEAMDPKPKVIVELGTYVGNSAVAWGAMLKDIWKDDPAALKECQVHSCELDTNFGTIARDFVDLSGLQDTVHIWDGKPAGETIRSLHASGKLNHIDVLFFDHWEKFYLPDLQICEELGLLRKGSVLIADNTDIPGAPEYLDYVRAGDAEKAGDLKYETKTIVTNSTPGAPNALEVTTILQGS
jgi:catechol O-methyltransferase